MPELGQVTLGVCLLAPKLGLGEGSGLLHELAERPLQLAAWTRSSMSSSSVTSPI